MRQKKLTLVLVLALASGGLAAFLALGYLRDRPTPLMAAVPGDGKVAVAARSLAAGSVLRNEDIRLVDWPSSALPEGYASNPAQLVGRGVISALTANEPLLTSKLADKEAGGGLPIVIPEGMRAVSVRVDEVVGVAGFVLSGTRVDVLVTMPGGGEQQASSQVILQNVQALAAGQTYQRDAEGKPQSVTVITLLVSPDDAETLALAANQGKIQLALRNTLDIAEIRTRGAKLSSLTRTAATAAPRATATREVRVRAATTRSAPVQSSGTVVETIRGGERTLSTFAPGN